LTEEYLEVQMNENRYRCHLDVKISLWTQFGLVIFA